MKSAVSGWVVAASLASLMSSVPAFAQEHLLDEVRIGLSASIQDHRTFEPGVFPSATVFFDPFDQRHAQSFFDHMLRPRVHVGTILSTAGGANQAYAGLTWTVPLGDKFFIDLGFGGSITDASLDDPKKRPVVGCRLNFHESAGIGYNIDRTWRILATIEHSSNADLCDENDGLTYAGIAVGYKF